MGAVPKSKIGPRRRRLRRTHYKLTAVGLVRCETCEAMHRPHHMCPNCGSLRGVQIVEMDEDKA